MTAKVTQGGNWERYGRFDHSDNLDCSGNYPTFDGTPGRPATYVESTLI